MLMAQQKDSASLKVVYDHIETLLLMLMGQQKDSVSEYTDLHGILFSSDGRMTMNGPLSLIKGTQRIERPKRSEAQIDVRISRNIDVTIECRYEHVEIPSTEFEREVGRAVRDKIQSEDNFSPIHKEYTVTLCENVRKTGDDDDYIIMPISIETEEYGGILKVRGWKEVNVYRRTDPTRLGCEKSN